MMDKFTFHLPTKIIFGKAAQAQVLLALAELNTKRALLVSDPGLVELGLVSQFAASLQQAGVAVATFTAVTSNPTSDEVATGLALARQHEVDVLVALGGGSPIDVAKGVALLLANGGAYADYQWHGKAITQRSWPLIAVPTTAGTGSEVSKVAVVSDPQNPFKKGVLSPLMFPHVAIVDPELTRGLPPGLTTATGMDAFIHALEAFVGKRANPFTDQLAISALQAAWTYLPRATADGNDMASRQRMMLAALWGGMAMDHAGLGLIHALSGPLTSHTNLHHGLANALLLPYVLRFNLPAIPSARQQILNKLFGLDAAVDTEELINALEQFIAGLGLPLSFSQIDLELEDAELDAIAEETTRMILIDNNPRPATAADCRKILEQMA
ncbi:MAG: iron-containing alcohol dehydrogenase [Anaerolineaceae bacterium]|nr:MAG: iron-containing alcohol dehydrogenase [Anaerolineaceae bacterium]